MQNSGILSGVMMLGHKDIFLFFSDNGLSMLNMMSLILKLYSEMGRVRLVLSTDTRIVSTTHIEM